MSPGGEVAVGGGGLRGPGLLCSPMAACPEKMLLGFRRLVQQLQAQSGGNAGGGRVNSGVNDCLQQV